MRSFTAHEAGKCIALRRVGNTREQLYFFTFHAHTVDTKEWILRLTENNS